MKQVEKVARAMAAYEKMGDGDRVVKVYTPLARAAIEAMSEPTEAMIAKGVSRAAGFASGGNRMCNGYRAMIEAALSETD